MIINRQHANGTILEAIKTLDELTQEELDFFRVPATHKITDFATFRVDRNKNGKITHIREKSFSEEHKANRRNIDIARMFNKVEEAIKTENLDADFARRAAVKSLS